MESRKPKKLGAEFQLRIASVRSKTNGRVRKTQERFNTDFDKHVRKTPVSQPDDHVFVENLDL